MFDFILIIFYSKYYYHPEMVEIDAQRTDLKIETLKPLAQSITLVNGPLIVVGLGPLPGSNSRIIFV